MPAGAADSSALAPFPLGRSLGWRQLIAFKFLNLRGTLLPGRTKFAIGRNPGIRTLLLHTASRASIGVIARGLHGERALLLVSYQCLRDTLLYGERRAKWLPTLSYLFGDIFREIVSVLCLHNFVVVNLHDRCGLSKPARILRYSCRSNRATRTQSYAALPVGTGPDSISRWKLLEVRSTKKGRSIFPKDAHLVVSDREEDEIVFSSDLVRVIARTGTMGAKTMCTQRTSRRT